MVWTMLDVVWTLERILWYVESLVVQGEGQRCKNNHQVPSPAKRCMACDIKSN